MTARYYAGQRHPNNRRVYHYTDPTTGIAGTLDEHADRLGVTTTCLRLRIKARGLSHPLTWAVGRSNARVITDCLGAVRTLTQHALHWDIPIATLYRRVSVWGAGDRRTWGLT